MLRGGPRRAEPRPLPHALALLSALVLLVDGTGSGQLHLSRDRGAKGEASQASLCLETDCGGQATRLEGIAVSVVSQRFEKTAPTDHPPTSRSRVKEWGWSTSRLDAEVHGVIRSFGPGAWRRRNGHISDRPLISTSPAQGPPAAA
jgi:hypothetical protein